MALTEATALPASSLTDVGLGERISAPANPSSLGSDGTADSGGPGGVLSNLRVCWLKCVSVPLSGGSPLALGVARPWAQHRAYN